MSHKKKIALVGWSPDVVDYSKYPGLTAEKLRAMLEGDCKNLNTIGYDAQMLYINHADTAFDTVSKALKQKAFDCVLIGAGVRSDADHFIVFEKLVNAVHQSAPSAKICFNTSPTDTAAAIKRWM
jgi:hypothetical protein